MLLDLLLIRLAKICCWLARATHAESKWWLARAWNLESMTFRRRAMRAKDRVPF